ncbi:MAG: hypothetical protein IJO56_06805 [Oscillospiraceae bacterium]|nr:hypothetical protein [Oscillospiraceae bacterium]
MKQKSFFMALGGVTAALAVTVMCLGTMIPLATYICPVLCAVILQVVLQMCGRSTAWMWYAAVAILSVLLSPDKEAAALFVFMGYYPILKPRLDKLPFPWLWKLLLFNIASFAMYAFLIWVMGMAELGDSFREAGAVLTVVTVILGNITFIMLDILLSRRVLKR